MMNERILDAYFDQGLLQLHGNDAWFDKITAAADSLSTVLKAEPEKIVSFVYSALDPRDLEDDPPRAETLDILKTIWRTFSSVSMGPLDMVLRGVILDSVVQNCRTDKQTKVAVALLLASALPHLKLTSEAKVWQELLKNLTDEIQVEAEEKWSVPGRLPLPEMNSGSTPTLTAKIAAVKVSTEDLEIEMAAAAGPTRQDGQATNGNPHWSNSAQHWSHEFAPRASKAIASAISVAAGPRNVTIKSDAIVEFVEQAVQDYVDDVAGQLVSAAHGVDLRSRLLWWKEAMVSPSAAVDYADLDPSVAAALMALDYQAMLPALAPVSVTAFLRQAVRQVAKEGDKISLGEHMKCLAQAPELSAYREKRKDSGLELVPLISLLKSDVLEDLSRSRTVFPSDSSFSTVDFAATIFLESQALKAVDEIEPKAVEEDRVDEEGDEAP